MVVLTGRFKLFDFLQLLILTMRAVCLQQLLWHSEIGILGDGNHHLNKVGLMSYIFIMFNSGIKNCIMTSGDGRSVKMSICALCYYQPH